MPKSELKKYEEKMNKTILALEEDYNNIRAGRANPHLLDKLQIDYYGVPTPVAQVGSVSVPEARLLQIQPWDVSVLSDIEKAINSSDIGINPINDGKTIRLAFPELTEERRKDITKDIKKKGEASKVAIRNIRRDAIDHFKKAKKDSIITEDDLNDIEKDIQKMTDNFIKVIDTHIDNKSKDILSI